MPDMNPDQTVIPDGPYGDMNPTPTAARSEGPYARMAGEVAKRGRYGDTMLMHVNPLEVEALSRAYPGMVTKNPDTGYPEAFWFLPAIAAALSAVGPSAAALASTLGASSAVAGGIGSVVGAVPGMLGTALGSGGLSGALVGAGFPGMATAGKLTAAGIGKLGAALPTISGKIAAGGKAIAGEGLAGSLTSGATELGGLVGKGLAAPVDAAAKVLGTGPTGGGAPPAAPPPGDLGIGDIIAKTGGQTQTPAQLAANVIKGGGEVVKTGVETGAQSQPIGQQILNMGGSAAKDLVTIGAKNIAPAATPLTTGEMLAGGLLGAQAIDAIIAATAKEEKEDWKNAKSSYGGPSSWSGRTYTGGSGGGGTGEQSYYSSGRVG